MQVERNSTVLKGFMSHHLSPLLNSSVNLSKESSPIQPLDWILPKFSFGKDYQDSFSNQDAKISGSWDFCSWLILKLFRKENQFVSYWSRDAIELLGWGFWSFIFCQMQLLLHGMERLGLAVIWPLETQHGALESLQLTSLTLAVNPASMQGYDKMGKDKGHQNSSSTGIANIV